MTTLTQAIIDERNRELDLHPFSILAARHNERLSDPIKIETVCSAQDMDQALIMARDCAKGRGWPLSVFRIEDNRTHEIHEVPVLVPDCPLIATWSEEGRVNIHKSTRTGILGAHVAGVVAVNGRASYAQQVVADLLPAIWEHGYKAGKENKA